MKHSFKESRVKSQEPSYLPWGDMTSEEYIIKLLQTIESLNSTMTAMRKEITFLRERLAKMDAALEQNGLERKRLRALIEAKDKDDKRLPSRWRIFLPKSTPSQRPLRSQIND